MRAAVRTPWPDPSVYAVPEYHPDDQGAAGVGPDRVGETLDVSSRFTIAALLSSTAVYGLVGIRASQRSSAAVAPEHPHQYHVTRPVRTDDLPTSAHGQLRSAEDRYDIGDSERT